MTKLNEKRDELCVETENADEQKGFVLGWNQCLAEVMPMLEEMASLIKKTDCVAMTFGGEHPSWVNCCRCKILDKYKQWQEYVEEK